jgi:glycosyltransferase involved in cell wall biosynthesis
MILGIDASNIRAGGTVTHLIELLRSADPRKHGFDSVIVWGGSAVLRQLPEREWLEKITDPMLEQEANPFADRRHFHRAYWQRFKLRSLAEAAGCSVLFVPGGLDLSGFRPLVAMSQNMLPFDLKEACRYGPSLAIARLLALRVGQGRTFRKADGIIFLTKYARDRISRVVGVRHERTAVIPHGVGAEFFFPPRPQLTIQDYSAERPFRFLYVSTIDLYKHQWNVAKAVWYLRKAGYPVCLDLAGPLRKLAEKKLRDTLHRLDAESTFLRYIGPLPYESLPSLYHQTDAFVFASSVENLPIILLEAMAAGLPIACSNRNPMPEVLGEAGVYFDPESPDEIATALKALIESPTIREQQAQLAFERAGRYSWGQCAEATFDFCRKIARDKTP